MWRVCSEHSHHSLLPWLMALGPLLQGPAKPPCSAVSHNLASLFIWITTLSPHLAMCNNPSISPAVCNQLTERLECGSFSIREPSRPAPSSSVCLPFLQSVASLISPTLGTALGAALMDGIRVCIGFSSPDVTKDLTLRIRGSKGLFYSVLEGSVHYGRRPRRSRQEVGDKLNRKGPGQVPAPGSTPTVAHFLHPRFHPPVPPLPNSLLKR